MTDRRKVPEIRFKGFEGEWEEHEFSGFVSRITSMCDHVELPRIEYEDIVSGAGILNKDVFKKNSIKRGVKFDEGDILFGKLRPYLNNLLWPHFKGIAVGDFWVLRANETDAAFVYSFIQNSKFQYVANLSAGSKMPRSDWSIVSLSKFLISAYIKEQAQIGTFFQNLDSLITLHQRKYDKLTIVKKAMLEKMFPKEGADLPEIRFKGFTEKWERRALGEIGSVAMNRRIFKEQTSIVGDVPFYKIGTFGGVPDAYISKELFEDYKSKYPYPEIGDILISASGSIGRTVEYLGKDEYFQDSNIVWLQHDKRLLNIFLKHFYSIVKWNGLEGSTIKRLYNKNILETNIYLPSTSEQTKIGTYFNHLDSLLTLQQCELDKLKNIKKACLEKMFV